MYVGAVALLVAIYPWGARGFEGYYTLLRFLVCGICTFTAYVALRERSALAFPFLIVGLVFNPFVPAHANRPIWIVADVVVAAGFLVTARVAPRLDAAKLADLPLIKPRSSSETRTAEISS
jgi:hypothetical protein